MSKLQVLELPAGTTPAQQLALINDRIRDLNQILGSLVSNPADSDFDMGNFLIHNLADPQADLDAVNLRTLKRFGGGSTTTPVASSGGLDAYTIVFCGTAIGFTQPGEVLPDFIVGRDRSGTPEEVWVYAVGAPVATPFTFNFTRNGVKMLPADLKLPTGSHGPVFSSVFTGGALAHRDVIGAVLTGGGDSFGISMGLVVKRT